jgi:hypothetical protein
MVAASVSLSTNGTTWTDISGYTNLIEQGEMSRPTGTVYTYTGDKAIIKAGKLQPLDLSVTLVYSEDTTAPYGTVLTAFQTTGGATMYLKWSPKGGATGVKQYVTDAGIITKMNLPGGKSEGGDPVVVKFTLQTPFVTQSAVT